MRTQKNMLTYLAAGIFFATGALSLSSCNESTAGKPDEGKQPYIIPDSLMKTLAVDTVRQGELIGGEIPWPRDQGWWISIRTNR